MDDIALELIREILNEWWIQENIPEEQLQSRIVLIFKKGDTGVLSNYRPISLLNALYKIFTGVLQQRIQEHIDPFLQKTQYGFRRGKSTSHAIHIIRRILDLGERTARKVNLVLLDWEKAFDKIYHAGLFSAMTRMGIHPKLIELTKQVYKKTIFKIEIDGNCSAWHAQQTGIRQGCPLSPYLFLIVMTVVFHDVHDQPGLREELRHNKVLGAVFDEVLYADDTIIFSESAQALEKLLQAIEKEGERYGMKLNKDKCESMCIGGNDSIHFGNNQQVPPHKESKYLGCLLNDKGDPKREISKRISACYLTWKRLETFWKHSDCSIRLKLSVYDAVVRSKLIYGLESVQVNDSLKAKIDAFQLKGLRQILKMQTTYVQRANSNEAVFSRANEEINSWEARRREHGVGFLPMRKIVPISQYYEERRRKLVVEILNGEADDPISNICIDRSTLELRDYQSRRVGRPRYNWWIFGLNNYWNFLKTHYFRQYRWTELNLGNTQHINTLRLGAEQRLFLEK